jgi:hypothetical protein
LSYVADCSNTVTVDLWYQATNNQKFRIIPANSTQPQYYIEAVSRSGVIITKRFFFATDEWAK